MLQELKAVAKRAFPGAYSHYIAWHHKRVPLAERITPILVSAEPPRHYDDAFDRLQSSFTKWRDDYEFDGYSTWTRGYQRALNLLTATELRARGLAVLETGCGEGMTGYALASYGHNVTLNDASDWRDSRAKNLPFLQGDICSHLPVPPESFDLLISYNTFEHVQDPEAALRELVRLCKREGCIYVEFAPLYCSPLGLHAWSFLMPYPQFLFSPSFIETKVRELGVDDLGHRSSELQPTNKWRLAQFREIWRNSGCEIVSLVEQPDYRHLPIVMDFPSAFQGRGLSVDDLTVTAVAVMLRKH